MDSRSGGRRLRDRLARLLRPANSLLRSPCSSSSSISTAFTNPAPATISTSSSTSTTAANYTTTTGALLPRAEPFSAALARLRHPSPEERVRSSSKAPYKEGSYSSRSRHGSRRHSIRGGVLKLSSNSYGFTTSDDEVEGNDDDDVSYADDETETFFSTRSVRSTDASVFYTSHKHRPPNGKSRRRHNRQRRRPATSCVDTCGGGGASEPGFRPLVAAAEEVRKGLAVVKRSRDPYGDFRESMVEVIVGRQVFSAAELERLLDSYMALNAPCLHPVILQAFSDIWVVLHGGG